MKRVIEVGEDPCRAEGGCPEYEVCKAYNIECLSFRSYVMGHPRIGIDENAIRNKRSYKFISDRMVKRKRLKEYIKMYKKPWKEPKVIEPAADTVDNEPKENDDVGC